MDVGLDIHDFRPWHFAEISEQMSLKHNDTESGVEV